jgi:hypothetical protein
MHAHEPAHISAFTPEGLQKFYVNASDVKVADDGIFVNFSGSTLIVQSIYTDECGCYIVGRGYCGYCGRPCDDMGRCQWPKCPNYGR